MVVIAPGSPRRPPTERHMGLLGNIVKGPIVIIVIKTVRPEIGNIQIRPAIVVVVTYCHAESPALVGDAGFRRHICEGPIMVVVKQHRAWRRLVSFQSRKRRPIDQINVQPSVFVVVKKGNARTRRFQDRNFLWSPRLVTKLVQLSLLRDVFVNKRRPVHEPAGGNRPRLRILYRRVRHSRTHAMLLTRGPSFLSLALLILFLRSLFLI